ncbi:TPA: topoisomerase DNA-binding C4 zinc finger domain-containing protein [Salmonella enterica subsp. salamae serovar 35:g,m,s,t:-]|nr:topoisomerase DNA-binding C4 zinc finger domain-containing protein [Salmonella enterica subsp. salamae serovar 35:g,m,s,t:-]HCA3549686.1 topoisomerase DNA-binding C4 zinc finger domain-containing protein [Salmonella enterica subsp. salamae serovar 35:g,m,s,t:-]
MKVYIAEKPELARSIVAAIVDLKGISSVNKRGYIQVGEDIVTWGYGHLMELPTPDVVNIKYTKWTLDTLPLQLPGLKPVVKEQSKQQFETIRGLISNASHVVHAGDPDEEGQCLIDEILEECRFSKPVERLLINDMNIGAVKKELERMKNNADFQSLRQKGMARQYSDYFYGMNMSRLYTLLAREKGSNIVLSVGRCQTPTLGIIVRREREIENFVPKEFYRVCIKLKICSETIIAEIQAPNDAPVDDKGRITDKAYADKVISDIRANSVSVSTVKNVIRNVTDQAPPLLFSILPLQSHMARRFDMDPNKTLEITQDLRIKHHALTYNRTDCKYASSEQYSAAPDTFNTFRKANLPALHSLLTDADLTLKSKAFNDKKISAHTAIIPVVTNLGELNEQERLVYTEIAKQYIAQFYPARVKESYRITVSVAEYSFLAVISRITERGWERVLKLDDEEDNFACEISSLFAEVAQISEGVELPYQDAQISVGQTTPPEHFTMASLLDELPKISNHITDPAIKALFKKRDEGREGDNKGIGTPATRAAMLGDLLKRGYITQKKKNLIPTDLGYAFFDALPAIATNPDITALWGEEQDMIEEGLLSFEEHMAKVHAFIAEQVKARPDIKIKVIDCPECGRPLQRREGSKGAFWGCTGFNQIPQCKATYPDVRGKPQLLKPEPPCCPNCKRKLKRIPDKKNVGKFYWACEGVWDSNTPCRTFLSDKNGKPVIDKKGKK